MSETRARQSPRCAASVPQINPPSIRCPQDPSQYTHHGHGRCVGRTMELAGPSKVAFTVEHEPRACYSLPCIRRHSSLMLRRRIAGCDPNPVPR
jgi:hypothetical protein